MTDPADPSLDIANVNAVAAELRRQRDEAREALDVVLIERNEAIRERDEALAEAAMADEDAYVEALTAPSDLRRAIDERNEARAERDNLSVEAHHWMGEAARYREALERIAKGRGDAMRPDALAADESMMIAREALGGSDA